MNHDLLPGKPIEFPRVALSLASLSLVGFSLVLFGQMFRLKLALRVGFATKNELGVGPRQALLVAILAGLIVPTLAILPVLWLRRKRSTIALSLERASIICGPLGVLFVVPGLFLPQVAEAKPLFYLAVLLSFGVAFALLLTRALELRAPRAASLLWARLSNSAVVRVSSVALLLLAVGGYAFVIGRYSIAHHRLLQTVASDVGVMDNVMANLLHGQAKAPLRFGTLGGNYLSLHAEYAALLFLPIYRLRPGAETLLWLQVACAAAAAIPLYLLVNRRLGRAVALWFAASYLLLAPLHGALLVGFSWMPAVILFSFTLYYAVDADRRWLSIACVPVLLLTSEAGALSVAALGFFLLLSNKRARLGLILSLVSVALIVIDSVRAARAPAPDEHPMLARALGALLENPVYFLLDLARANKLTSVLHALAPLCLLPLSELVTWPLFIPALLFTSASAEFWPLDSSSAASSLIWIPACFLALLSTLQRQRDDRSARSRYLSWLVALTLTQLSHSYDFGALLRRDGFGGHPSETAFRMTPAGQKRYDGLRQLLRRIPDSASVAATDYLVSHVSNRPQAFSLSRPYGEPDYILMSSHELGPVQPALQGTFAGHHYRLAGSSGDEFYLFSRGAESPETERALQKLGLLSP